MTHANKISRYHALLLTILRELNE